MMTTLITVTKAAQMLGTTPVRVMQLCWNGELPSGDIDGTMVVPVAAVHTYAKGHGTDIRPTDVGVSQE